MQATVHLSKARSSPGSQRRTCNSSALAGSVLGPVLQGELARRASRRVVAVEAGAAEAVLPLLRGCHHRISREVGEGGGPDLGPDLLHRQVRSYQLVRAIHVDTVVAGALDRGRRDPEVDLGCACFEEQLDQLAAGVATTMESSTTTTLLPSITLGSGLSLSLMPSWRIPSVGWMK